MKTKSHDRQATRPERPARSAKRRRAKRARNPYPSISREEQADILKQIELERSTGGLLRVPRLSRREMIARLEELFEMSNTPEAVETSEFLQEALRHRSLNFREINLD